MRSFIPALLGLLLLQTGLAQAALPVAPAPNGEAELQQAQTSHQGATRLLASLDAELQRKQALHARLAARIEELKSGPIQDFRLESLQRTARTMADELRTLQQRRAQAAGAAEQARIQLGQRLRQRLATLVQAAPQRAEDRLRWVHRQEELLAQLRQIEPAAPSAPLPAVPRSEVRATDGPEELRELADELADVSEKYLQHAQALARRIGEVLEQRRLARLAEDLAREEGLFDEAVRYRKVGRLALATTGKAPTGGQPPAGGKTGTEPQEPGQTEADGEIGGSDDRGSGEDWASGDGTPSGNGDPAVPGEYDGAVGGGETSVGTPGDPRAPDLTGGTVGSGGSEFRLGLRDNPDSARGIDQGGVPGLDLAGQLRQLERQRTAASQRAQSLLRQAESLRRRASVLEAQEGP